MSFYTRRGDDGTTGLLGKSRVPKHDARIEAIGTIDESSAAMGVARTAARDSRCAPLLLEAQRDLYLLMAEVAATAENVGQFHFDAVRVEWIEQQIEALGKDVQMPGEFIPTSPRARTRNSSCCATCVASSAATSVTNGC